MTKALHLKRREFLMELKIDTMTGMDIQYITVLLMALFNLLGDTPIIIGFAFAFKLDQFAAWQSVFIQFSDLPQRYYQVIQWNWLAGRHVMENNATWLAKCLLTRLTQKSRALPLLMGTA
ncbi:hypothetical protein [Candidatus Odyssella thessalonicensis]|uniref:hypothetical protein n=1 Tax=Candidatus Odyssella thessalonicensis TaxID=84647 RepID=UPI0011121785|nr:hypothetical protein [Candidatus Odyssella thessalonicensis]